MKMMHGAFFFACSNMSRTRRRADADEHLDEVGAGDGEEGNVRLAGDGAREQRLAGAGRSDQQHAARNPPAEALELLRVAQELDDLLQVLLGLVDAGDVLERHAPVRLRQKLRLRLAEAERLAAGALHLAHEEDPHRQDEEHREPRHQHADQRLPGLGRRLGGDLDAVVLQPLDQIRVLRRERLECRAVRVASADLLTRNDDVAHPPLVDVGDELRIGDVAARDALAGVLEQVEKGDQNEADDHPQGEIAEIGVHPLSLGHAAEEPPAPVFGPSLTIKIGLGRYEANKTCQPFAPQMRQRAAFVRARR